MNLKLNIEMEVKFMKKVTVRRAVKVDATAWWIIF